jgi:hypothetical protein
MVAGLERWQRIGLVKAGWLRQRRGIVSRPAAMVTTGRVGLRRLLTMVTAGRGGGGGPGDNGGAAGQMWCRRPRRWKWAAGDDGHRPPRWRRGTMMRPAQTMASAVFGPPGRGGGWQKTWRRSVVAHAHAMRLGEPAQKNALWRAARDRYPVCHPLKPPTLSRTHAGGRRRYVKESVEWLRVRAVNQRPS